MFDDDGRDEILESPITLCCEGDVFGCQYSLGLLSMSRSTRNCWDAMSPWPSTSLASSAGSSTSTAALTNNNVLASVAGSADRGCGEGSLAAEKVADQPPVASILGELQPITASSTV